jgi:hypothetical protein
VRCRISFIVAALTAAVAPVNAQTCSLPDNLRRAAPTTPPPATSYTTVRDQERPLGEIPLGVGHLHPRAEETAYDWYVRIQLPLSAQPGEVPFAAIVGGWLVRLDAPARAFTSDAMIETGYEVPTFIVQQTRPDGWLLLRYGRAADELAWVHSCALTGLVFTPWSEWLLSPSIPPLQFRTTAPHALHAAPNGAVLSQIEADYHLEPLEVRGNWMRVKLNQPSDFCFPDKTPKTTEGWIEWSSPAIGPTVWYPSRGC